MKQIKVKVELTEGYEKRFTEACCKQIIRNQKKDKEPEKT